MRLAAEAGARTVALPAISAGIYGYPLPEAARVGLEAVRDHLGGPTSIERATFVLYSVDTLEVFETALDRLAALG